MSKINNHDDDIIYDILNYVDVEENYDEDFQLDQITSKRIKKNIYKKLNGNKKRKKYIAAAVLLIGLGTFTFINPTFAANIQNSIIQTMQVLRGDYADYKKYAKNVNLSSYDKGIQFKINEIVSDGNKIIISYSIISDKKISEIIKNPHITTMEFKINEKMLGFAGGGNGELVDDNRYDGILDIDTMREHIPSTFYLSAKVVSIDKLEGNWNFNIKVNKNDIQEETKDYKINKTITIGEDKILIKKISISPISTSIEVNGSVGKYHYFLLDDKGNEILASGASSNGHEGEMHYNSLINKDTKYLTFIPFDYNDNYTPNPKTYDIDKLPLELPIGNIGKLIVKNVSWDNDTLKISYIVQGKFPLTQSRSLCLLDEKGKFIECENNLGFQKDPSNQHEFEKCFKEVSKNKKYKIGILRFEEFYILNEKDKFNIDLK